MLLTPVSLQIVAKFPDVTEDNIIQLGPNHVIFSDYYTFELTKHGECARHARAQADTRVAASSST